MEGNKEMLRTTCALLAFLLAATTFFACAELSPGGKAAEKDLPCAFCHDASPETGAHVAHAGWDCDLCHAGYSKTGPPYHPSTHDDGVTDVNGVLGGGQYSPAGKQCSNIDCHGYGMTGQMGVLWDDGTVGWLDTLSCGGCHDYTNHMTSERQYLSGQYPGFSVCYYCHVDSGFHADTSKLED